MDKYIVYYRYRGSNYRFMTPDEIIVRASSKAEAKKEAILQVGDIFTVVKVEKGEMIIQ